MDYEIKIFMRVVLAVLCLLLAWKCYCTFINFIVNFCWFLQLPKKKDDIFTIPKEQNKFIYLSVVLYNEY